MVAVTLVMIAVLLRSGLVALFAASLAVGYGGIAAAADWSAWHARTTVLTLIVITALAAYGAWSAISGWERSETV